MYVIFSGRGGYPMQMRVRDLAEWEHRCAKLHRARYPSPGTLYESKGSDFKAVGEHARAWQCATVHGSLAHRVVK